MWEIATREKPFKGMFVPTTAVNVATAEFWAFITHNNANDHYLDHNLWING